jgi:hypothetical protein
LDGQRRVSESTARAPSRRPSSPTLTPPQSQFTPETSPRRDRKSPGLTIDPSAPLRPPRDSARPSPPVPIKSPLRRLTSQPSTLSERSQKFREGSGESTAATSDSFLTAPLPSPGDGELLLEPGDDVAFPASYSSHEPGEIRFTMLTVPSVYSQDSAPSTAKSTASATGETESLRSARSGSYGWGQQRYSVVSMDGTLGGIELHNVSTYSKSGADNSAHLFLVYEPPSPILERNYQKHPRLQPIQPIPPQPILVMLIMATLPSHPFAHLRCRS